MNAVTAIPPIAYLIIFIAAWGNSVFTMVVAVSASCFCGSSSWFRHGLRSNKGKPM